MGNPDHSDLIRSFEKKREKRRKAGWEHSICLKCFRKRRPNGKPWAWQVPASLRQREVCCFCLQKHSDGIHKTRDPQNRELRCMGIHQAPEGASTSI